MREGEVCSSVGLWWSRQHSIESPPSPPSFRPEENYGTHVHHKKQANGSSSPGGPPSRRRHHQLSLPSLIRQLSSAPYKRFAISPSSSSSSNPYLSVLWLRLVLVAPRLCRSRKRSPWRLVLCSLMVI
ncbi:hypothetical protein CRG98_026483 [Punica granatum]|uniref:Uncharacterized protein n=1 Tax=Punica granatum TaxID=22663 RepID=A0A2I0JA25_PUNGR|nr:hypothetical protein CRG98_026483 [Punica granatum]